MGKWLTHALLIAGLLLIFAARGLIYQANWENQTLLQFVRTVDTGASTALGVKKKVVVVGKVSDDPDRRDTSLHVNVEVENVDGVPIDGTLIAFFSPDTELEYGQRVVAKGTLRLPDAFETETGTFDYPHYLQVHGISAMLTSAKLSSSTPAEFSLFGVLYKIKHTFDASLEKIFLPPHGALMEGMLLGERRGIPEHLTHAFVVSSLIHIVVLSGQVLTLVADAVMRTLGFLPRKYKFPVGAVIIVLFVLMVGASSVAVRAGIMALIGLIARFSGRQTQALRSLCIAAALMILWNPPVVLWDASFILSVVATFGLIVGSPVVEKYLLWIPQKFQLRTVAASTLAVEIFIVPALLYFTGTFSLFALPANMLALPVLPWAMFGGFLAGALNVIPGVLGPILAFIPAFITQLLLRWIVFVATTIANIPYASAAVVSFPLWAALLMYVPLIVVLSWRAFRTAPRQATNSSS